LLRASRCHCAPFSQALTSALYVMTSGCTPAVFISSNTSIARCHCAPFPHALMSALYV
jgi:hypothetical protein